jgi:lipopolysaccharide transport protein LptA
MAPSRASWFALALLGGVAAHAAGPQLDESAPIHLDARSTDLDYKNNGVAFHSVRITQGPFAIEADHATASGLDFKASHWVFTGNVRITMPDGSLSSDEARIEFVADAIANAQITGAPAAFEQKRDKRVARGHALHIDYDFAAATVRLRDDAQLTDGETEITARTLIYDMRLQRLRGGTTADDPDGQQVRILIPPKKPEPKPNP